MREFSVLKQRILQYIEYKNITKYEFYKTCGLANGILSQSSGLSEDNLLKILNYCRDLNQSWLVAGIGEMIIDEIVDVVAEPQAEYVKTPIYSREKDLERTIEAQKRTIETQQDIINLLKKKLSEHEQDAQGAEVADAG